MLVVVPLNKAADPLPGQQQAGKWPAGIAGAVLQRFEQRLRVRVIVTFCWPTKRRRHTQRLQGSEHSHPFHRAVIIRMQHDLIWRDLFPITNIAQHLSHMCAAFGSIDLPVNDL